MQEAMQRMVYSVGADTLNNMPMVIRGQPMQVQQQCQQLIADIPNLRAFIEQYKVSVGGAGMNMGFNNMPQTTTATGFTGGNAWATIPTQSTQNAFGGTQSTATFADFGSFSNSAANAHAAAPTGYAAFTSRADGSESSPIQQQPTTENKVPGGAKASVAAEGTAVTILGVNEMDYENHRLYYPGSNVNATQQAGSKANFFGILATSIPVVPKERVEPTDGRDLEALREEHIVLFPDKDDSLFAFGQAHAIAMMTAKLIPAVGVDLHYQSYLMDYYDVAVRHIYDSESTLGLVLQDDINRKLINPSIMMDLDELASTIVEAHKSASPVIKAMAVAINIAATKTINEIVYKDVGFKAAGTSVIESFASDYKDLIALLRGRFEPLKVNQIFYGDGGPGACLVERVRNLIAVPTIDMLTQISAYLNVEEATIAGRALYAVDRRLLLGIPHTVYDLGIACKAGINDVNPMETPALYNALKHSLSLITTEDAHEMTSFHILTSDQVRFEVIYSHDLQSFSLVQN